MSMCRSTDQREVSNFLDAAVEHVKPNIAARPVEQIKSHAADAPVMQTLEFIVRRLVVDAADAAEFAVGVLDRVESRRVVEAVHARLDDDGALDADHREHFLIVFQRRRRRRVLMGRDERKQFGRPEDMKVRVAGVGRRRELGFARVGIGRITVGHESFSRATF